MFFVREELIYYHDVFFSRTNVPVCFFLCVYELTYIHTPMGDFYLTYNLRGNLYSYNKVCDPTSILHLITPMVFGN